MKELLAVLLAGTLLAGCAIMKNHYPGYYPAGNGVLTDTNNCPIVIPVPTPNQNHNGR